MSYRNKDWSFAELSRKETLWGPHGYHRYPAKFIPHLVRRIIDEFSLPGEVIGDIFLGSGTTGVEAIRTGRQFYGSDINPVACLISRAKCFPIDPSILNETWKDVSRIISQIAPLGRNPLTDKDKEAILSINISYALPEERLQYWFPESQRQALTAILKAILSVPIEQHRIFMLCAFSNILKRCSIWLSGSTKAQKDLKKTLADPVDEFLKQVRDMMKRNKLYWEDLLTNGINPQQAGEQIRILQQDARSLDTETPQVDLLVTSPPYATCYEYSELHQLTQLWFEKFGIISAVEAKQNWIGSKNVSSGTLNKGVFPHTGSESADTTLRELLHLANQRPTKKTDIIREARALHRYFIDMNRAICEMTRIVPTGKQLVLIIGDSRKRDVDIPTTQALCEMSSSAGFALQEKINRKVPGRVLVSTRDRETGKFSSTANSDVEVYPEENVLVFKRV
ncbi:MAG: site-specific DNA-methyltransferase [Anaerolineaceae bacterium]|nr:site-specific DNA-methyltransferase [Anaerolineaceae bacterium]